MAITAVDLNAEANHRRLMTGSIGSLNIKDSSKHSNREFSKDKPFSGRELDLMDSEAMLIDDHDVGFLAENPFEFDDGLNQTKATGQLTAS